jgi:hypothetical protein
MKNKSKYIAFMCIGTALIHITMNYPISNIDENKITKNLITQSMTIENKDTSITLDKDNAEKILSESYSIEDVNKKVLALRKENQEPKVMEASFKFK